MLENAGRKKNWREESTEGSVMGDVLKKGKGGFRSVAFETVARRGGVRGWGRRWN